MLLSFVSDIENVRVDLWLSKKSNDLSRTFIKKISEEGGISVNGKVAKCSEKLKIGDVVEVTVPEVKVLNLVSQDIHLDILYEDSDIIVVDKPKGMVVHPACGNYDGTLVNALLARYGDKLSLINGVIRPGIVHRIDKDTSGVLVVARNNKAHENLALLFKDHNIKREYIALVEGVVKTDRGKIDAPIGRHPVNRKKMAVVSKNSRPAVTYFNVVKRFKKATLIEATLETGRTHQIRVHMAYMGHPVAGDPVYGRKKGVIESTGQLLHAKTLGFVHPSTGEFVEFIAPLPEHFIKILSLMD